MLVNSCEVHAHLMCVSGEDFSLDPFSWDFVGKNVTFMAIEGFVYFILNVLIQYRFFLDHWWEEIHSNESLQWKCCFSIYIYAVSFYRMSDFKKPPIIHEDVDVAKEREKVYKGGSSSDILQIKDLSKASLSTLYWCMMGNVSPNWDHECVFISIDVYWNN